MVLHDEFVNTCELSIKPHYKSQAIFRTMSLRGHKIVATVKLDGNDRSKQAKQAKIICCDVRILG